MLQQQSEKIQDLATALAKFQGEAFLVAKNAKVKIVTKTGRSIDFGYSDLEEIRKTIRKPLSENNLCFTQIITTYEGKQYLVTILMHGSGQWIKSYLRMNDAIDLKELGSNITYLKRYSLAAMLGLVADDDLDAISDEIEKPNISYDKITMDQALTIVQLIGDDDLLREEVINVIQKETKNKDASFPEMPLHKLEGCLKFITQWKQKKRGENA